ncbi:SUR7/PalI family-domain-containing protein [Geopyxis carbonaria]|nr:SUR7/PalI family-domain-containing protein [Geopyxis carbonaria]
MVSRARPLLATLSLILIGGTIVLLFLLILAGSYDKKPLNEIFFLQADTRGIPNAPDGRCHWTLYNFCDERDGKNINCRPNQAAYPFLPQRNFDTKTNIPQDFINNPNRYFYLSRFLYSFYIIDVFFTICALLTGLVSLCSNTAGLVSSLCSAIALFCVTFSATIMTACFVLGQRSFRNEGRFARVGVKAFAFTWTCVALLFMATIGFFLSCLANRRKSRYNDNYNDTRTSRRSGGFGMGSRMFRKRQSGVSDRTRDSADSKRRINKEYN